jgi:hypothetical protein
MIVFVCGIKPFCCYFTIFFGVDQGHLRTAVADGRARRRWERVGVRRRKRRLSIWEERIYYSLFYTG